MRHLRLRHGSDHNHSPDTSAAKREREAVLKRRRQQYQRTLSEQTQAIHQAQGDQRLLRRKQERYNVVGNKEARLQEQLRRSQKLKLRKRSYEKTKTKRHEVVRKRPRQMARKRKGQQPRPEDMEEPLLPEDPKRPRQLEDRKKTQKKSSKMPCKMAREKLRQMARKLKHPQYHPEEGEEPQLPEGRKRPRHLEDRKKTHKKSSKMLSKVALETPRQMTRKRKHQQQSPEECKEPLLPEDPKRPRHLEDRKKTHKKCTGQRPRLGSTRSPGEAAVGRPGEAVARDPGELPGTSFGVPPTKHSPPTSVPRDLAEPQAPKLHRGTQTLEEAAKAPSRRDTSQQTNYPVAELDQEIVQVSKDSKPALSIAKQQRVAGRSPKDQKCGRRRGALEEPQAKGHVVEPRPGGGSILAEGQRPAQPRHHTISSPATATRGECPPAAE